MLHQPSGPAYCARLQFSDAASCARWLETLPAQRPTEAHEMIAAQIGVVGRSDLPAPERLSVLETLHRGAESLQAELAKQYIGGALPLSIVEYSLWRSVVDLWQALFEAYESLLRRCFTSELGLAAHAPLLALRAIELTAAAIQEHHRVYREVPGSLWRQLHQTYAFAEHHRIAASDVADPPPAATRTSAGAYGRTLLAHLSNPYTMSPRQMAVMYRWVALWESLLAIGPSPVAPGVSGVLAVDLESDNGGMPARHVVAAPSLRYIGLERLGHMLRRILTLLRQGEAPGSLGLGHDVRQPGCERLLTLLYIQWCGRGTGQIGASNERGEDARAAVGFEAVCQQLRFESEASRNAATGLGALTEPWYVAGTSAPGFLAVARGPECDRRIKHHQLLAIRRRSAANFQLAVAQWLRLEEDGELSIGLRLLPGIPHMTSLQAEAAVDGDAEQPAAILLPAVPEMRTPATLILPPESFQPNREVELLSGTMRRVKLVQLLERGTDFDRAAFEIVA